MHWYTWLGSVASRTNYSRRLARSSCRMLALVVAVLTSLGTSAKAAIINWNGSTSAAWTSGVNWTGGTAPANDLLTDIASFNLPTYGGNPVFAPDAGTVN